MSDYGAYDNDRSRPYRNQTTRVRRRERDEPEYVEETTFVERGKGPPPRDLVYRTRQRDRDDDVEEIPRDFPPPERRPLRGYRDDYEPPRRARSVASRRYDDELDDYAGPAAAGAAAGYAVGRQRGQREADRDREGGRGGYDRRRERRDYYSEDESPPRRRDRSREKKSQLTEALEGLGLGGLVGAISGKERSRSRNRGGGRRGDSRESSRSRHGKKERQWAQAAQAAVVAGAIEAFRSRGEPGKFWSGEKGKRIATAAISAGGIDKLVDRDPDSKGKTHLFEAVAGGLVANRLANGPREGPDGPGGEDGRGRSQSRARSASVLDRFRSKSRGRAGSDEDRGRGNTNGIQNLAAGGAILAAGKAIYDRVRSKSRRRSASNSSDDSYVPSRARRGRDRDVGPYSQGNRGPPPDENAVVGPQRGRGGGRGESQRRKGRSNSNSSSKSSSSMSSTDMEERRKKLRGKEFVTAGLATIATIHAAHGVYQSMEASDKRHKLVAEGEMTPEVARKKRSKAWLQDAAAVGIAALGIKGAYSEWKEMNEQRHSVKELEERRRKRRRRQDRRMKEAREGGGGGGGGPYMSGGRGGRDDGYYNNTPYPYSSGGVPPPPMGGPPYGR